MSLSMEKTTVGDVCSSIESAIIELQSTLNTLSTVDSCLVISDGPYSLLSSTNFDSDFINSAATKVIHNSDNSDNSDKIMEHNLLSKNSVRVVEEKEDSSKHHKFVNSVKRRLL